MMKDEEHRLLADEAKLLWSEANRLQAFWENQFKDWVQEKATLNQEIFALRESLSSVEDYYKEATNSWANEFEILKDSNLLLKQKEDYYLKLANDKIQTDKQLRDLKERDQTFYQTKTNEIF